MSTSSSSSSRLARDGRWTGFALVLLLFVAWEFTVRLGAVRSESWPAVSNVLLSLVEGFRVGDWYAVFASTLYRMAAGFLLAVVLGVVVGLLLGASPLAYRTLIPTFEIFRVLPAPALVPPLIFFLGVDDKLKIVVVALSAFFPIALNTFAGVRAIDPVHTMVARTFRKSRRDVLLRIQLPSALPYVFAGCRISLAISLVVTVVSEMIAGSVGVGYYIVSMQYAMRANEMYAAIVLLSAIGYGLNRLFIAVEARAIHWSRAADAHGRDA